MPKRPKKRDVNQIAADIVARLDSGTKKKSKVKNPAAVALGRLGGLRGGRARADRLSGLERSAIARMAARARWGDSKNDE